MICEYAENIQRDVAGQRNDISEKKRNCFKYGIYLLHSLIVFIKFGDRNIFDY